MEKRRGKGEGAHVVPLTWIDAQMPWWTRVMGLFSRQSTHLLQSTTHLREEMPRDSNVKRRQADIDLLEGADGFSPLHYAAGEGHEAVVALLLERLETCNFFLFWLPLPPFRCTAVHDAQSLTRTAAGGQMRGPLTHTATPRASGQRPRRSGR